MIICKSCLITRAPVLPFVSTGIRRCDECEKGFMDTIIVRYDEIHNNTLENRIKSVNAQLRQSGSYERNKWIDVQDREQLGIG